MATLDWLQLAMTDGLGPILIGRLVQRMGSAEAACHSSLSDLQAIEGLGSSKAVRIHQALQHGRVEAEDELTKTTALGFALICRDDESYPALLREIIDPPSVLYVHGSIQPRDLNAVAIVGSRKCSYYGREQAQRFGALLAGAGFTVISGGARGIDSASHRGALQHDQGRTIAVLGCGLDIVYPPENKELFAQIARQGAVISEYRLGTEPRAENFPRRNRIVSGMSRGVLVIEADVRSGALITARLAGEDHNRAVMALPGRVDSTTSAGTHRLIRDGATLVSSIEDIVEDLGPVSQTVRQPGMTGSNPPPATQPDLFTDIAPGSEADLSGNSSEPDKSIGLTGHQSLLLEKMEDDTVHIDVLIERTGLGAHEVLRELTFLSLKGRVKRIDGQTFVRCQERQR